MCDNLTDQQLVEKLKEEDDEIEYNRLYREFYNRFSNRIYRNACIVCSNFADTSDMAREITQLTFINAEKALFKFKFPEDSKPENHKYIVLGWLGTIANNLFKKEYAKKTDQISVEEEPQIFVAKEKLDFDKLFNEDLFIETPSKFRLKLQAGMDKLTEREKYILEVYAHEQCIGSKQHLGDKALRELCELYDTNSVNIRQIKKRALDKLKKYCLFDDNKINEKN